MFYHPEPWGNDPNLLIFFKWVETTKSFSSSDLKINGLDDEFSLWGLFSYLPIL